MKTGALTSRYYVRGTSTDVRLTLRRLTLPLISRRASCVLLITPLSRRGLQEEHSAVCKWWFLIQSIVESPWIIFFVGLQGASEKFKLQFFGNAWTFYCEILHNHRVSVYISMVDSTKVLCPENLFSRKLWNTKVVVCGNTTFVPLTPALAMTIIDSITIYSSDVNKTRLSSSYWQQ